MNEKMNLQTNSISQNELVKITGGLPVLPVLGAITAAVSVGKILDQVGEWFLQGWNDPK